jgi:hypothetical protein
LSLACTSTSAAKAVWILRLYVTAEAVTHKAFRFDAKTIDMEFIEKGILEGAF